MINAGTILYVFFAGAGGGCFALASLTRMVSALSGQDRHGKLAAWAGSGFCIGGVLVVLSCLFLVTDLGQPSRAWQMALNPFASIISLGAWFLAAFAAMAVVMLFLAATKADLPKMGVVILCLLGATVSVCVMSYTGLLFFSIKAVSFWDTWLIIALFVASSLSTGAALLSIASTILRASRQTQIPGWRASRLLYLIEAVAIAAFFIERLIACTEPCLLVMAGDLAPAFWLGVVVAGIVIPSAISKFGREPVPSALDRLVSGIMVFVGGFCLRLCVLSLPILPIAG